MHPINLPVLTNNFAFHWSYSPVVWVAGAAAIAWALWVLCARKYVFWAILVILAYAGTAIVAGINGYWIKHGHGDSMPVGWLWAAVVATGCVTIGSFIAIFVSLRGTTWKVDPGTKRHWYGIGAALLVLNTVVALYATAEIAADASTRYVVFGVNTLSQQWESFCANADNDTLWLAEEFAVVVLAYVVVALIVKRERRPQVQVTDTRAHP